MLTIVTKRMDRVTLVRCYSLKDVARYTKTLNEAKNHAANGFLKRFNREHSTLFTKAYEGKASSTGISFTFSSVQKKSAIAIGVNPALMSEDDWADFLSFLETMFDYGGKEVWESFRLSKLEIAMDVKVPFSEMVCFAPQITEIDTRYLNNGTLYIGHKFGHRSFCIYDKRKQLAEKKKVDLGHDRTRIEVRHRNLGKTFGQLEGMAAPFGRLIAIRKLALNRLMQRHPLDYKLKAFIESIMDGQTAQEAYLELDSYTRKRITKLVRQGALQLNSEKMNWLHWFAQQQHDLKTRFLGQVQCN